jgi:hypothetical protein
MKFASEVFFGSVRAIIFGCAEFSFSSLKRDWEGRLIFWVLRPSQIFASRWGQIKGPMPAIQFQQFLTRA